LTSHKKELLKTWIASLLWLGIIFTESTDQFSAEHTSRYLYPLFHFLLNMDLRHFEILHHYLRKTGHFIGYFTGSLILFGTWQDVLLDSSAALTAQIVIYFFIRWRTRAGK
jgi:VanZ family protein